MAPPDKQQTTRPLLDEVLLDAKLSLPDLSGPGIVGRGVLVEAARASGQRFVSITAPAGYGKTTLLSQWLDVEDRMTAYVSLNRFDDDPNLLLALLASAYERMYPNSGATAEVSGLGVSALGRATPRLAGILGSTESPFVLIIDDLHELQSDDCQDVLGVLMSGVPDHSQLVTSSRTSQPNIPRLRASGQVMEIGIAELALDSTGAHEIFAAQRVTITPKQASLLAERTEGWPVGLYLASLIAIESDGDPLAVTGDDRYLADYLYDELIHRLPNDVRQFLYRTSVLDELSAPLCDALLETTGSQQMLRYLESNRMFLFPLDRRSEWYRYHDLFREFLLGEVRRYEPESVEQLHLLAANWYEAEGATTKAVEHLLETADKTRCAFMIAEASLRTYQSGHMPTIARWFKRLGDVGVELYPPLASLAGQLAALQGLTAEAEHWLAVVEHNSYDETPIDGTASFESGRAIFRSIVCPNGPEEMLADAQFALAQEPPESLWRDGALDTCAQAYLMLGDRERARALFEETAEVAEKTSGTDNFVIAEAELAIMDIEEGRPAEASRHAERSLTVLEKYQIHDYGTSLVAFAAAARVALQRGDMSETKRLLAVGMRSRQFCTAALPYLAVRGRLHLAKAWLALAEKTDARHLVREINDILHIRPKLGILVNEVEEFREKLSSSATPASGRAPLTPAELRVLPYLQTHLTFRQIAERLFVSQNTIRTQVASIYRKLGVGSRSEAVQQAQDIGLVGG